MTTTTTPGGCSANSGTRGSTGASSNLPTSSAASRSPGASLKTPWWLSRPAGQVAGLGDVPAGLPQPVGRAFRRALHRRDVVDPHLGLRRFRRLRRVALAVVVVVVAIGDCSLVVVAPEPIAWNPTSRNTTPRNSSTITMARRGSPEELRWFIALTVSTRTSRSRTPERAQVTSKPSRRAARAFCRLARNRRSRLTSIGSAASASGRSTSALSTW